MVEDLRPEIPSECPDHLAVLMRQCWHVDELVRPNFKDLLNTVRRAYGVLCSGPRTPPPFSLADAVRGCLALLRPTSPV